MRRHELWTFYPWTVCAARSMYGVFEMAEWKERNEPLIIASDKKHWRNGFETFVVSNFMCGIMANVQQRCCLHLSTAVARTCLEPLWGCALLEHFITALAFCNISQFQKIRFSAGANCADDTVVSKKQLEQVSFVKFIDLTTTRKKKSHNLHVAFDGNRSQVDVGLNEYVFVHFYSRLELSGFRINHHQQIWIGWIN